MAEKEYINLYECRDDFYETVLDILSEDSTNDRANQIIDAFDYLPTADVAPVRHAKWELIDECINEGVYCSNCHKKIYRARAEYANQKVKSNYCPNCGARMDGDTNAKL